VSEVVEMAVEAMAVAKEVARDWVVVEVEMAEEAVEVAKAEEAEKADAASVLSREGTVGVKEVKVVVDLAEAKAGVGMAEGEGMAEKVEAVRVAVVGGGLEVATGAEVKEAAWEPDLPK
jgi:hypothetical protein